jgi:hypothetical protein
VGVWRELVERVGGVCVVCCVWVVARVVGGTTKMLHVVYTFFSA